MGKSNRVYIYKIIYMITDQFKGIHQEKIDHPLRWIKDSVREKLR